MVASNGRDAVRVEEGAGITHLILEAPPANALGMGLVDGLERALSSLETGSAGAIVISSALPRFFAAGADIKHMSALTEDEFAAYRDALRSPLERLATCGRPSIAAVDGL